MTKINTYCLCAGLLLLGACAVRPAPLPGESADAVRAKLGQPTSVYDGADGQVLEYATGPMGQYTWMARLGPDGRLLRHEQVLHGEMFSRIKIGAATKDDVLRLIGRPAERSRVLMGDYEVWSYRYKESDVWNSMMHIHFDRTGIVRLLQNGPDPMHEKHFQHD